MHCPTTPSQVKDYTWCDEKMGVRIWVKVPGVHTCRPGAVAVRFRELSFDVTVTDLGGKDYAFAVRAIPVPHAALPRP